MSTGQIGERDQTRLGGACSEREPDSELEARVVQGLPYRETSSWSPSVLQPDQAQLLLAPPYAFSPRRPRGKYDFLDMPNHMRKRLFSCVGLITSRVSMKYISTYLPKVNVNF